MKYCAHCGKELFDEAVICVGCGCAVVGNQIVNKQSANATILLNTLSQRLNTNGIIWLVIGILQILGGIFINWFLLIVGVLNKKYSLQTDVLQYSILVIAFSKLNFKFAINVLQRLASPVSKTPSKP